MVGWAKSTIESHAKAVMRATRNSAYFGKTPTLPERGPMPFKDETGMGLAVEMEYYSMTAKGKITEHIQWDSVRKPCSTFTKCYQSSRKGIKEGFAFGSEITKSTFTSCQTQFNWF